jgi:hypothetical protein
MNRSSDPMVLSDAAKFAANRLDSVVQRRAVARVVGKQGHL